MKLSCILTSCNSNELYLDFIPIFIKSWGKLVPEALVKIILISKEIPQNLYEFKENLILFEPIDKIPTDFTSQYIRLLYPCILNKINGGILITDIDMIPMNRQYFFDNIKDINNEKFICFRNSLASIQQLPICYNIATQKIWSQIFEINNLQEIKKRFEIIEPSWSRDQIDLYDKVQIWNKKTGNLVYLDDKINGFNRLCRSQRFSLTDNIRKSIQQGYYTDYHMYRPYKNFKLINDTILELLNDNDFISGEKYMSLADLIIYNKEAFDKFPSLKKYSYNYIFVNTQINSNIQKIINNSKIIFIKPDFIDYFQCQILPLINHNFILITHNSDLTVGKNKEILNNKYLIKWYGQNMIPHPKTCGIPIGIQNSYWLGSDYNICQKYYKLNKNNKNKVLYINFNLQTNKQRTEIVKLLSNNGFNISKNLPWEQYIEELSKHKFCISPPGNGVDCHRIWEAIYVGCIPIVEKNPILDEYFNDLPILFIDMYDKITEEFLNQKYNEFLNKHINLSKTKISYWNNEFKKALNLLT